MNQYTCIQNPTERFFSYVQKTETCWNWIGGKNSDGYGHFWLGKRPFRSHRFVYELYRGKIPEGLDLDHLCRNRACVNPWHLEAVSTNVNTLRGFGQPARNARKIRCSKNHSLSGANLYIAPDGSRQCRICRVEKVRQWRKTRAITTDLHKAIQTREHVLQIIGMELRD